MYLKKQIKNCLLASPFSSKKKKVGASMLKDKMGGESKNKCFHMLMMHSIDEGSTISTTSLDAIIIDDDMNTSCNASSGSLKVGGLHNNNSYAARRSDSLASLDNSSLSCSMGGADSVRSRSRLRGTKSKNSNKKSTLKRKSVHFDDMKNELNIVESYVPYASDLWWSKEEVKQRHSDFSNVMSEYNKDELVQITEYARAYHKTRQDSSISIHEENDGLIDAVASKSKVSIDNNQYQLIVNGKANGWDGLEIFLYFYDIPSSTNNMALVRKSIITRIVNAHYDLIHNNTNNENSIVIGDSSSSRQYKSRDNSDRILRSISKSLTSVDRSWAVIMGKADRDAYLLS